MSRSSTSHPIFIDFIAEILKVLEVSWVCTGNRSSDFHGQQEGGSNMEAYVMREVIKFHYLTWIRWLFRKAVGVRGFLAKASILVKITIRISQNGKHWKLIVKNHTVKQRGKNKTKKLTTTIKNKTMNCSKLCWNQISQNSCGSRGKVTRCEKKLRYSWIKDSYIWPRHC